MAGGCREMFSFVIVLALDLALALVLVPDRVLDRDRVLVLGDHPALPDVLLPRLHQGETAERLGAEEVPKCLVHDVRSRRKRGI